MVQQSQPTEALLRTCIEEALTSIILGETPVRPRILAEAEELTKADVEKIVRRMFKNELDDQIRKQIQKELKSSNFEEIVTSVTGRALARFFEIMFTRKSTWQNQLKSSRV